MIPITPRTEPHQFDIEVRQVGAAFLAIMPTPKSKDWKRREYWSKCLGEVYERYNKICAYSSTWIPKGVHSKIGETASIDHYLPKHKYPHLAYEWDNYRLASTRLNSYKDTYQDVLDPFTIEKYWFVIDFRSMKILPGNNITSEIGLKVEQTIKRLKLNTDIELIQQRFVSFHDYYTNRNTLEYLNLYAPFIASEIRRQNIIPGLPIGEP